MNNAVNNRAQVPGYCGYIPGKSSENKFGATFRPGNKGFIPDTRALIFNNKHCK
jgi:hypothetical protein